RARTSCTPTWTGTSATSAPAGSRSARAGTRGSSRRRGGRGRASGGAFSRSTSCRRRSTPPRGTSSPPTTKRRRATTPTASPHPAPTPGSPGHRPRRLEQLSGETARHTVADTRRIQTDTSSLPAGLLRPHLLAVRPEGEGEARALELVAGWDLRFEVDRCG